MAVSLKQPPCFLSDRLLRPRPPPPLPPISASAPPKDRCPLHLSFSTTGAFLSHVNKKPPRPVFHCSAAVSEEQPDYVQNTLDLVFHCSAAVSEEQPDYVQNTLDLFFYMRPPDCFLGSLGSTVTVGGYYACIVFFVKWTLDTLSYPWLISAVYLGSGFLHMLYSWLIGRFNPIQETDGHFWKSLFPVAIAHTIGLVAQTVSLSLSPMVFTHVLRCAEPVFSILLRFFLKREETYSTSHYVSLLPIIAGVAITILTEPNCNRTACMAVMIANAAFAARNILKEKMEDDKRTKMPSTGQHYITCLSTLSLLILAPFTFLMEGPRTWTAGWESLVLKEPPDFLKWLVMCHVLFYCLYNEGVYDVSLPRFSRFNFFLANTTKKISVVLFSIIALNIPLQRISALGAALAILGIFLYSRELCKNYQQRSWLF